MYAKACMCGGQKLSCKSPFFPSCEFQKTELRPSSGGHKPLIPALEDSGRWVTVSSIPACSTKTSGQPRVYSEILSKKTKQNKINKNKKRKTPKHKQAKNSGL